MTAFTEADVEAAVVGQLEGLGYRRLTDDVAGPDGSVRERDAYPPDLQDCAVRTVLQQAEALSSNWMKEVLP